jgi:excisionase family DNA binding protein
MWECLQQVVENQEKGKEEQTKLAAQIARAAIPRELYSVKEVSALTGLQTKTIRRAIKLGKLPQYNMANGEKRASIRIHRRDIDVWYESCKVNQAPPKSQRDALADHYFPDTPKRRRKNAA